MFCAAHRRRLASMSTTEWSDVGVSGLPTGTVTLLLADVEGSTRLWETQPEEMAAAVARLDQALGKAVATHDGVRPVEQGEGDSFVVAFGRASDAVACALDLQRAPLAPIRLRIGIHTGEVRLAGRRSQLHRPHDQSHGATARFGPRRPNRALGGHRTNGSRSACPRGDIGRARHLPVARSAPPGTGNPAVSSRPAQ